MTIEKSERINNLLNIYKELLTAKQQDVLDMYFLYDLSLAEIAENENISRSAVYDLIQRSTKLLESYEEKLHLLEKKEKILNLIEDLDEEVKQKIEELL